MTDDRRALVLGASRGIGAAIARRLDADGFDVTIVARSADGLAETAGAMSRSTSLAVDLASEEGRATLADALEHNGQPHVVVGVVHLRRALSRISRTDPGEYAAAVGDHLGHLAAVARTALPAQREAGFGRWVFVSSLVASLGGHGQSVYAAQKSAMESFSRSLAVEEGRFGITSNVVVPGFIATDHMAETYSAEQRAAFEQSSVVQRSGRPDEVAHVVSFLADERAGFVTGASVPVTGGAELSWWLGRTIDTKAGQ